MINTLKRLMLTSGVSGREQKICEAIRKEVEPYADEVFVDAMGNLVAHKRGKGKRVMLAAHMDEIGFLVTSITSKGIIKVAPIGAINYASSTGAGVISERGVCGIMSSLDTTPSAKDIFIDIGATSKAQAEKRVSVGEFFVHTPSLKRLIGTRYVGRPIDDRIGCAILIEVLRTIKNTDNDLYFVFTTQEEVGSRGARPITYTIEPEIAIAVDITRTDDKPGEESVNIHMGAGPTIKIKDASVICSHELVLQMRELAEQGKIKYQNEMITNGGTDTSVMQIAKRGCRAGAISVPCAYIHTTNEMIDINDARGAVRLLSVIAERI